ncbi:MAG: ATP-dependent zinc protease [Marinagarivorans sp.]|nr:ATP-dependent zinc protease [Marinagarivorans sp.]
MTPPLAPCESKIIIGSLETCDLPQLGISNLQIRVDTGAKTSSLHVDNIKGYKKSGKPWVKFDLHPDIYNVNSIVTCDTAICDIRRIKSSNGDAQERYVIKTPIQLGSMSWPIEITLTDRSDMSYLMLFGREGMGDRVLVDPSQTFLLNDGS